MMMKIGLSSLPLKNKRINQNTILLHLKKINSKNKNPFKNLVHQKPKNNLLNQLLMIKIFFRVKKTKKEMYKPLIQLNKVF